MAFDAQQYTAPLEAMLFVSGEAMTRESLKKILGVSAEELTQVLEVYRADLAARSGALVLIEDAKLVRLGVAPEYTGYLETLAKGELQESLSKAALEVLALVAYLAPVARADIDVIRGVNSSFSLRNLSLRGLVHRSGNPRDARGYVYEPSIDFLTTLGLGRIEELPSYEALRHDERLQRLVLADKGAESTPGVSDQQETKETESHA
jgi:segregation and condensation protein B